MTGWEAEQLEAARRERDEWKRLAEQWRNIAASWERIATTAAKLDEIERG